MTSSPRPFRPSFRRWIPLILAVLCGVAVYALDRQMKRSDVAGFAPANADLVIASDDFAAVWHALESQRAYKSLQSESPELMHDLFIAARKATGIRWTPKRWRAWFGSRIVFARIDDQLGVCLRPGILARAATSALRLASGEKGDVVRENGIAFGWRDGFLVASDSAEFVELALAASAESFPLAGDSPELRMDWRGEPHARLAMRVGKTISIEGWVDVELSDRDLPLTIVDMWADEPMLEIAGTSAEEIIRLVAEYLPDFPGLELIEQAFDELEGELPTGWNAGVSEFTLALTSVDTSEFLAVPEFALALRGEEVLPPLRAPREAIPYEWAGLEGWFRPWLGEKMSVCTVSADDVRLFASQEPLMARYAGRLGEGRAVDADVFASVDVRALSTIAGVLVARAAEHELLPYWNAEDVEARVLPAIEGSRHLGRLVVTGEVLDKGLHVQAELKPFVVPIPEGTTQ